MYYIVGPEYTTTDPLGYFTGYSPIVKYNNIQFIVTSYRIRVNSIKANQQLQ